MSGKLEYDVKTASDYPAVGDYVMANLNGGDMAVIHAVLPRKSVFLRKAAGSIKTEQVIAANVDTLFLCMALNNDFNLRRPERYLTTAWDSGAVPVVLLTKTDLCDDLTAKTAQVEGVAVIVTPGIRELGMWDAGEGLSTAFADIESLANRCRFKNCAHQSEPGCAVRAAMQRGELPKERLLSYEKLRAENAYSEDAKR